ncbi:uncharacterized protein [Palaemon carinicauda]|uniref:uncharacterized protein n=1 Tax=Palaemon carinicauda TaxID=392227 RepID=UPI0035B69168
MLTLQHIRNLLPKGAYIISTDVADAYRHLPVIRPLSSCIEFRLQKTKFVFKAMPFGLHIAPRIFTKLADTIVQQLRSKGVQVVAYLDHWLVLAVSKTTCLQAAGKGIQFLKHLGFKINRKKSCLSPA